MGRRAIFNQEEITRIRDKFMEGQAFQFPLEPNIAAQTYVNNLRKIAASVGLSFRKEFAEKEGGTFLLVKVITEKGSVWGGDNGGNFSTGLSPAERRRIVYARRVAAKDARGISYSSEAPNVPSGYFDDALASIDTGNAIMNQKPNITAEELSIRTEFWHRAQIIADVRFKKNDWKGYHLFHSDYQAYLVYSDSQLTKEFHYDGVGWEAEVTDEDDVPIEEETTLDETMANDSEEYWQTKGDYVGFFDDASDDDEESLK